MSVVSIDTLKKKFPPFKEESILIEQDQSVPDIINEILEAHQVFERDYDKIALYFKGSNTRQTCNNIFSFLKKNIKYIRESDNNQTTRLPIGILEPQEGDCKHYSSFAGGILDALNRKGCNIDWLYCFASYKLFVKTPYHVFVIAFDDMGNEIVIDPTPEAEGKVPMWTVKKSNCLSLIQ